VIFRRLADDSAVLVVASGDKRVDETRVAHLTGALGRADASFVKAHTGFSIGGVAPLAHQAKDGSKDASKVLTLIDRTLFRFDHIWAAAGHPNGVFQLSPDELVRFTGAPVHDLVVVA
jgi:prolyl-tRNA editing enzyme YbaK/EbsC (Cys-tRNA(Pro) deacylase)